MYNTQCKRLQWKEFKYQQPKTHLRCVNNTTNHIITNQHIYEYINLISRGDTKYKYFAKYYYNEKSRFG